MTKLKIGIAGIWYDCFDEDLARELYLGSLEALRKLGEEWDFELVAAPDVTNDVAVCKGMTGLQLNGEIVHHDDAVSGPRHETAGIGNQVAVVRHDVAIGEPMLRGEGHFFRQRVDQ